MGASLSTAPSALASAGQVECLIGSSESCPATSPQEIYNLYGTTAANTYWMKVNGTATQVYLYMNPADSDGGGWILLMKGKQGTTNFNYDSNMFTSNSTTRATDSLSNDVTTDAKFGVYNSLTVSRLLAVLKDPAAGTIANSGDVDNNGFGGHVWLETLSSPTTAYSQLLTARNIQKNPLADVRVDSYSNVPTTKYLTSSGAINLSYQAGNGRYGFNGTVCGSENTGLWYRWGVVWNQEGDFGTCDVVVGIGISTGARTDIPGSSSSSPGDHVRWSGAYEFASVNRTDRFSGAGHGNMGFQIWGKVADPSLGAPTVATPTTPASEQVNLSWTAPAAVTPVDYVVQYKTSDAASYSNSFVVTGQTTAQFTGLTGGTAYNFRVIARTASNSTASANFAAATKTVTPYKALTTPSAPTVTATANTLKSLDVSWSAITSAVSYTLKLYTSAGVLIPTSGLTGLTGTSTTITTSNYASLADSTTYKVSITAIGNGSSLLDSSESPLSTGVETNAPPGLPTITVQPTSQSSTYASTATFSVTATTPDSGTLAYQWQVSTNSGGSWSDVSSGTGGTTASHTTATLAMAANGYRYRVNITNAKNGATSSAVTSSSVTLTVAKADQAAISSPVLSATTAAYNGSAYSQALTVTSATGGSNAGALSITGVVDGIATGCSFSAGTLTKSTSGTCTLTVTKAGDDNYNAVSTTATFTFTKANQSTLTVTTSQIRYKTAQTLVTSGGSGNGLVTYELVPGDCTLNSDSITGNRFGGTCSVVAKKAASANYEEIFSDAKTITIALGLPTGNLYLVSLSNTLPATIQTSYPLIASVSIPSKVAFFANARPIPGCTSISTKAVVGTATCNYKPISLGLINLTATITPIDGGYSAISKATRVRVNSR